MIDNITITPVIPGSQSKEDTEAPTALGAATEGPNKAITEAPNKATTEAPTNKCLAKGENCQKNSDCCGNKCGKKTQICKL